MPYKDPDKRRAYQRERQKLAYTGHTTPLSIPLPTEFRLKTARDVLALLEEQVNAVRGDTGSSVIDKARTIGYLASSMLRAIEQSDLLQRLETLEAVTAPKQARAS